ncbi:hypothetical protein PRIPAC_89438 [Pristionchus pacificus]|uniref:Str-165 protein n=1 Tax=Pristionchus pacificus TaxID=54126 RepID=A0A2A6CWY1_PRIPA|nr:hypothetical protein PRIPAC_89438 [Pristionchus pacificus]|eukprot:PDM82744.1 str-165 protein [Pristionchus pacificus]
MSRATDAIESCNIVIRKITVTGFCLNALLLFLIITYSRPTLGNYRYLLKLFACNDLFLITMHAIVRPASFSTGSALGLFSHTFPDSKYPIYIICSCFTIPFTLMNINFLHRYWSVKRPAKVCRFSNWRFCAALALYPLSYIAAWMTFSLTVADDPVGRAIIEPAYLQFTGERRMSKGWLLICIQDRNGDWNTETLVLTIIEFTLHMVNVVTAAVLCTLTLIELRSAKFFSPRFRILQIKVLRALLAQSLVPVIFVLIPYVLAIILRFRPNKSAEGHFDYWCPLASSFPAWDALVLLILMRDYRRGLKDMLRKVAQYMLMPVEAAEYSVR